MNNIAKLLIIVFLIVSVPITVKLVQNQQIFKSKAAGEGALQLNPISCGGNPFVCNISWSGPPATDPASSCPGGFMVWIDPLDLVYMREEGMKCVKGANSTTAPDGFLQNYVIRAGPPFTFISGKTYNVSVNVNSGPYASGKVTSNIQTITVPTPTTPPGRVVCYDSAQGRCEPDGYEFCRLQRGCQPSFTCTDKAGDRGYACVKSVSTPTAGGGSGGTGQDSNGSSSILASTVCTPGSYKPFQQSDCTGNCGGCANDAGEAKIYVCKSDGSGYEDHGECRTECAGSCRGGGGSNYCTAAGYHDCTGRVGQPAGTCQKNNQTCTAFETYECNFDDGTGRKDYCGPPFTPNAQSCVCGGGSPSPSSGPCDVNTEAARQELIRLGGDFRNATCARIKEKVCTDCTIFVPPNAIRTALCPGTCGGGTPPSGNCPADSNLTVSPSTPNIGDTMTFQYRAGEDVYIGGDTWSGGVNPNPCTQDSNLANRRYTCSAQSAVTGATWKHYWNNGASCGFATYTIGGSTTPTSTSAPTGRTASYRIAETLEGLDSAPDVPYTTEPITLTHTFTNETPGDKWIYVRFKGTQGEVTDVSKKIKLIGPNPTISNISCGYSPTGVGTQVTINGTNFGDKGNSKVIVGGKNAEITFWAVAAQDTPTSVPSATPVPTSTPTQTPPTPTPLPYGKVRGIVQSTSDNTLLQDVTVALVGSEQFTTTDINGIWIMSNVRSGTQQFTFSKAGYQSQTKSVVVPAGDDVVDLDVQLVPTSSPTQTQNLNTLGVSTILYKVMAKINERFPENLSVPVQLTTADGRSVSGSCSVNTTTLDFNTVTPCRPAGSFSTSDVRVQIYENAQGAKPVFDGKITLGLDGKPSWIPPKLEIGKNYTMIIKAPKTLALKKEFTALEGTTVLDDVTFPVGDIAPLSLPDEVINSIDKGELVREWTTTVDVTRPADFNMDSRVNSIDYSCMLTSFNKSGEKFLGGQ